MEGAKLAAGSVSTRVGARPSARPPDPCSVGFAVRLRGGTTIERQYLLVPAEVESGFVYTKRNAMRFAEGQTIVHPHHGPATVRAIKTKSLRNAQCSYLLLEVHDTDLTIGVPLDGADTVGLRPVLDADGLEKLFEVLRGPSQPEENQWSRRFKDNQERLRTGDIYVIAGLVRDLSRRLEAKGTMSHAEKEMLRYARKPLVTEIGLAMGIEDEEAEQVLDGAMSSRLAGV